METCGETVSDGELSQIVLDDLDQSRWMEKLPQQLREIPLNLLAIPGSHETFTFYLDKSGPISPDVPPVIQRLGKIGQCARNIVYNWSTAQSLSVCDQLNAGIRYFDIRVGAKPHCSELYAVHGLYGPSIESCLEEIASFLDSHTPEVVLLDFNHFYAITLEAHRSLIGKILERFGSKLCPLTDLKEVTLKFMSDHGFQLIVFYHDCIGKDIPQLWPGCGIDSPWPNSVQVTDLLTKLEANYKQPRKMSFYVTQGVLTPDTGYVVCHLCSTLKATLARDAARPFVEWLKTKTAGRDGINICIMDCVELQNYVAEVIQMNHSHLK